MDRKYCDRCGEEIPKAVIISSWIKYYDHRDDESTYSMNWEYGSFKQYICVSCLDEIKPVFHAKVATEPAFRSGERVEFVPVNFNCVDCWLCRLKKHFRRTQ
jgi:hypothetical protein